MLATIMMLLSLQSIDFEELRNQNVRGVYADILKADGAGLDVPLKILKSDVFNAWTDGESITLTTAFLNEPGMDNDKLALVLAHEVAHILLEHTNPDANLWSGQRDKEAYADKLGAAIMMKAGYNICKGKDIFKIFYSKWGDCADCDHPDNSYRYNALNLPECNNGR